MTNSELIAQYIAKNGVTRCAPGIAQGAKLNRRDRDEINARRRVFRKNAKIRIATREAKRAAEFRPAKYFLSIGHAKSEILALHAHWTNCQNWFGSIARFADFYDITQTQAQRVLRIGAKLARRS